MAPPTLERLAALRLLVVVLGTLSACGARQERAVAPWTAAATPRVSPLPEGAEGAYAHVYVQKTPDPPGLEGLGAVGVRWLAVQAAAAGASASIQEDGSLYTWCTDPACPAAVVNSWMNHATSEGAAAAVAAHRQEVVNRVRRDPASAAWWRLALEGHPAAFRAGGRLGARIGPAELERWRAEHLTRSAVDVRASAALLGPWRDALEMLPVRLPPDQARMSPPEPEGPTWASGVAPEVSLIVGTPGRQEGPEQADEATCWVKVIRELTGLEGGVVSFHRDPALAAWIEVRQVSDVDALALARAIASLPVERPTPCSGPGPSPLDARRLTLVLFLSGEVEEGPFPNVSGADVVRLPADPLEWIQ